MVVVAIAALALGLLAFQKWTGVTDDDNADPSAALDAEYSAQLATLQEQLKTSLALPLDFKQVNSFELLDKHAASVNETVFDDRWSLVFFGYTHCPDVCPITLQVMKNVIAKLQELNQPEPQIVFVSVDPVRDTSEVLNKYIGYFDEQFVGITGDQTVMHDFTSSLGIVASFTANDDDPENYIVDHTASLLLIDPQRRVRAKVTPPHEAQTIVDDYLTIIAAPS
jgi:protein SCO1/2